jgi:hypothetical protein
VNYKVVADCVHAVMLRPQRVARWNCEHSGLALRWGHAVTGLGSLFIRQRSFEPNQRRAPLFHNERRKKMLR